MAGLVRMRVAIPTAAIMKTLVADVKKDNRKPDMFTGQ